MQLPIQREAFKMLSKFFVRHLNFTDASINDKELKLIIENALNLTSLNISGCQQLDVASHLKTIASHCLTLEKLYLDRLPQLLSIIGKKAKTGKKANPLSLPTVKFLSATYCSNLTDIELHANSLQSLFLDHCPLLISLKLEVDEFSTDLESFSHINSEALHYHYIETLLVKSPRLLETMQLKSHYPIRSSLLFCLCISAQRMTTRIWTTQNVAALVKHECLNITNPRVNDNDLKCILTKNSDITAIDLSGNVAISWQSYPTLLSHCTLTKLNRLNYTEVAKDTIFINH